MKSSSSSRAKPLVHHRSRLLSGLAIGVALSFALVASLMSLALADTPSFADVPSTHPFYNAITDLASRNIISGYVDGDFGPGDDVMRQQFAKMIVLALGYPVSESDVCPFADVLVSGSAGLYPDNYVAVCAAHGITTGKSSTTFDPYAGITRYQVVTMVARAIDDTRPGLLGSPPAGWHGSAGWASDPIHGANAARAEYGNLLLGLDLASLDPHANMTRGEVAQVLHNLLALLTPSTTTTATVATSTTTTASTSTTTTASTTTTTLGGPGSTVSSTSTTLPQTTVTTDYAVAGLEASSITVTPRDQFGRPMPYIEVFLTTKILEGSGLTALPKTSIGLTDVNGNVAYNWSQGSGDWGVEQVTAWVDDGSVAGLSTVVAVVQWILDDTATDHVSAVSGQQKVTIAGGYTLWNGLTLKAYLNPAGAAIGSGTYVSSAPLNLTTTLHTWSPGEAFFVGAISTNIDTKPNWMYNVVP